MAARNGGILKIKLKLDVRQFLDGKYNSKLADTVNIDLRHSSLCFYSYCYWGCCCCCCCCWAMGILQSPPSDRPSVTLFPPKPLDEIQPNLVCVCFANMNWVYATAHFFCPAPWGPGEGQKVKYY